MLKFQSILANICAKKLKHKSSFSKMSKYEPITIHPKVVIPIDKL
jgi:hypothetical protein